MPVILDMNIRDAWINHNNDDQVWVSVDRLKVHAVASLKGGGLRPMEAVD